MPTFTALTPLEGEDAGSEREGPGHVFLHQEAQDFPVVGEPGQDDLADLGAGQAGRDQGGADFLVTDLDDVLVAGIGLLHVRPLRDQLGAGAVQRGLA